MRSAALRWRVRSMGRCCSCRSVPDQVRTEISRLGAQRAVILGGSAAVGEDVADALRADLGANAVTRISGANRFETADRVATEVVRLLGDGYDGTAFVATGGTFPDALAAAPLAAARGWPLYLADPSAGLSDATVAAMAPVTQAVVLGGESAVPAGVEADLVDSLGADNVVRLAGATRYQTAVEVAGHGVSHAGLGWTRPALTTGENFPDALAGGVLQGKRGSVMLLTPSQSLHPNTAAALETHRDFIASVTFLGGIGAVSQEVRNAVLAILE
jgi:putative cell wall-binding protein